MPGIRFARAQFGRTVIMDSALAAINTTYEASDVLAFTTNATYAPGGRVVARPLLAADKAALYGAATVAAAPAAPTLAAVTAATFNVPFLANGTYYVVTTYVSATGETLGSTQTSQATAGGTQAIQVTSPSPVAGAVGYKVYCSAAGATGGPYTQQGGVVAIGTSAIIGGSGVANAPPATGANPPIANTTGKIAGVAGVAEYSGITNAGAQWSAFTSPGGIQPGAVTLQLPGMGAALPQDPATNQGIVPFYLAVNGNVFSGAVAGVIASPALNNQPCGLIMAISGGITTYTVDPAPPAGTAIGVIIEPDQTDPLYNGGPTGTTVGGRVLFMFNQTYSQFLSGINYTAQ